MWCIKNSKEQPLTIKCQKHLVLLSLNVLSKNGELHTYQGRQNKIN